MFFGLTEKDMGQVRKVFRQFPEIDSVIIFGSRALGIFKKGSDVDLALKGVVGEDTLRNVHQKLNDELPLPYFFDVIIYEDVENLDLKKHVDDFGKIFYQK